MGNIKKVHYLMVLEKGEYKSEYLDSVRIACKSGSIEYLKNFTGLFVKTTCKNCLRTKAFRNRVAEALAHRLLHGSK